MTEHKYTDSELLAIAGPRGTLLTHKRARQLLSMEPGNRPRIYGIRDGQTEILKIHSTETLNRHKPDHVWMSEASLIDMIRPA